MKRFHKYSNYLLLSCLTMAIIATLYVVNAAFLNSNKARIYIAQTDSTQVVSESNQIKKVLLADAKKKNWQPQIGLITIVNNYAIASVYDRVTGGESVLTKSQGQWKIIGGGGGAITRPEQLTNYFKVPSATARRLLQIRTSQQR